MKYQEIIEMGKRNSAKQKVHLDKSKTMKMQVVEQNIRLEGLVKSNQGLYQRLEQETKKQ